MISTVFSAVIVLLLLIAGQPLMGLIFGRVEEDVMEACVTYLRISAYSYPALAVYNAGAALYRSIGRLLFSILFAVLLEMGVTGIAAAMCLDWCIRAVVFYIRFRSGKWKEFQLI